MIVCCVFFFCFFKQKTAYEMRISDWSSDVCSSDLPASRASSSVDCASAPPVMARPATPAAASMARRRLIAIPAFIFLSLCRCRSRSSMAEVKENGRESCRERVCQNVKNQVVAVSVKKKEQHIYENTL